MPIVVCPGCGVTLESNNSGTEERYNASRACYELYLEKIYPVSLQQDGYFVHQIVVDAYAAQHSSAKMKPITVTFALIGLYLVFEKGCTGRQAQLAHIELGKIHREWPSFYPPPEKAILTVQDVLNSGGPDYREMIMKWGQAVWDIWKPEQEKIAVLAALANKLKFK